MDFLILMIRSRLSFQLFFRLMECVTLLDIRAKVIILHASLSPTLHIHSTLFHFSQFDLTFR